MQPLQPRARHAERSICASAARGAGISAADSGCTGFLPHRLLAVRYGAAHQTRGYAGRSRRPLSYFLEDDPIIFQTFLEPDQGVGENCNFPFQDTI